MNSLKKSWLMWLAWLAVVIGVIWFFAHQMAYGATPPKPRKPTAPRKPAAIQQGDGAFKLISPAIIIEPYWMTNWVGWDYSDWLAVSNFSLYRGATSGVYSNMVLTGKVLSNQIVWLYGTTNWIVVTAKGTNGLESDYSNEIRLPQAPLTNYVMFVTSSKATNLQWCSRLGQPWTLLGATNYTKTNGPLRYWRGVERGPSASGKVFARIVWF